MKIGSLCTGYGGLDLAAEAFFNAETIWCAEFDKYASQVIDKRFNVPNHGDIKLIDWSTLPKIDILTAGYPCQPFSNAGPRKGTDDPRHIWPHIQEAISILRPKFVILENVRGHLTLGLKEVLKGLTKIGYDAKWQLIRASDAGAPHRRERIFIIAQPTDTDSQRCNLGKSHPDSSSQLKSGSELAELGEATTTCNPDNEHKPHDRQMQSLRRRFTPRCEMYLQTPPNALDQGKLNSKFVEYMMGLPAGWVTDCGLSRAQELKILGNGVVPQQAELALELLMNLSTGKG